jgi:hypothetical protein
VNLPPHLPWCSSGRSPHAARCRGAACGEGVSGGHFSSLPDRANFQRSIRGGVARPRLRRRPQSRTRDSIGEQRATTCAGPRGRAGAPQCRCHRHWGDAEVAAAQQATRTIPIVMAPSGDPVRAGYVASLARPGGNITAVSFLSPDVSAKLLEVLKDALPKMSRVAVLWNSANPTKVVDFDETQRAAQAPRLTVFSIEVKAASELETALTAIRRARADALLILVDQVLSHELRPRIAEFAIKRAYPVDCGQLEIRGRRRPHWVWAGRVRDVPPRCGPRREGPEGGQPGGPSRRTAYETGVVDQPQDRQSSRSDDPPVPPAAGGSGHRVMERRTFLGVIVGSLLAAPLAAEAQQTFSGSCQAICF